jgi:hypothetical protein
VIHDYIHVGGGAWYCKPCEVLVTERAGAAAVKDMKEHEANPYRSQA